MRVVFIFLFVLLGLNAKANICDRHFSVQQSLADQIEKPCDEVTDADLKGLLVLILDVEQTESLSPHDFDGMDNLEILLIDSLDQSITTFPPNLFRGLPKLRQVRFVRLGFKTLPGHLFQHNPYVEEIFLLENQNLEEISADFLAGLKDLYHLTINTSPLVREIPNGFFQQGTSRLRYVKLLNMGLTQIPERAFEQLPRLSILSLEENQIQVVPESVFAADHFSETASVYLRKNPLKSEAIELLRRQLGDRLVIGDESCLRF